MPLAPAIQNASKRAQVITWTDDDGNAIDLTGATLYGRKRDKNGVVTSITGTLVITGAATLGVFTWSYSTADLATPGSYFVQFNAVYASGLRNKTYLSPWRVFESLDFASTSPSASLSPSASMSPSSSPSA